jgi:hypothetical protein
MQTSTPTALADVREAMEAYRTCEFATIAKNGTPIAWPTIPLVAPDGSSIVLTTSIGLPRKAINIRRDARVALLFSDPTGSGRTDLPQVLVQGTATCPDELHTSPVGLEEYWMRTYERQPASAAYSATPIGRWLFDWYYMRLVITVTPTTVTRRSPLTEPGPLAAPRPTAGDRSPYAEAARRLPTYRSAVLGTVRDGDPASLVRVHLTANPEGRRFLVAEAGEEPLTPGPASVLLHRHNDQLWDLRNCAMMGELTHQAGGWAFSPTRFIPGNDGLNPLTTVRALRQMRRTAESYLATRHLARPEISWAEFKQLTASAVRSGEHGAAAEAAL